MDLIFSGLVFGLKIHNEKKQKRKTTTAMPISVIWKVSYQFRSLFSQTMAECKPFARADLGRLSVPALHQRAVVCRKYRTDLQGGC